MTDREISAGCMVAYGLWIGVALLMATTWALDSHVLEMVMVTIVTAIGAATSTVRQYMVAQNRMMKNAFDMGKADAVRHLH